MITVHMDVPFFTLSHRKSFCLPLQFAVTRQNYFYRLLHIHLPAFG